MALLVALGGSLVANRLGVAFKVCYISDVANELLSVFCFILGLKHYVIK